MEGRDITFIDFCFAREQMEELRKIAKGLTVLDHHEGTRDVATSFPGVFDVDHSGAMIAWRYYHPDAPAPLLFEYLEDFEGREAPGF